MPAAALLNRVGSQVTLRVLRLRDQLHYLRARVHGNGRLQDPVRDHFRGLVCMALTRVAATLAPNTPQKHAKWGVNGCAKEDGIQHHVPGPPDLG